MRECHRLPQEQERIRQETFAAERQLEEATASLAEARTIVETALSLLDRIAKSYRSAKPETRRKFNSAFFDSIIVTERHVIEYTLNEPFKTLLAQECQTSDELWTKRAAIGTLNHLASLLKEVA